ncbi:unnamed protein product, partial [Adineta steineri]
LALFSLKTSAWSFYETLALISTAIICLTCLAMVPPGRETSKYTRIFDIFIGKTPDENKNEVLIVNKQSSIPRNPVIFTIDDCSSTETNDLTDQKKTTTSNLVVPLTPKIIESKIPDTTENIDYSLLTDEEILSLVKSKKLAVHNLEKNLPLLKAVHIRRLLLNELLISTQNSSFSLDLLPYDNYDYSLVINHCCENVIGYVQIPVGYAGPLRVDNRNFYIPMATTE